MMKGFTRKLAYAFAGLLLPMVISAAPTAAAVDVFPVCTSGSASKTDVCKNVDTANKSSDNPIIGALKVAITILTIVIGITAVIMIIISGLWFMTANGDPQAIGRARSSIIYALVGLIIVGLSQTLVVLVLNKL